MSSCNKRLRQVKRNATKRIINRSELLFPEVQKVAFNYQHSSEENGTRNFFFLNNVGSYDILSRDRSDVRCSLARRVYACVCARMRLKRNDLTPCNIPPEEENAPVTFGAAARRRSLSRIGGKFYHKHARGADLHKRTAKAYSRGGGGEISIRLEKPTRVTWGVARRSSS